MAEIQPAIPGRAKRVGLLLGLVALTGCGDGPTLPVLTQPGFVLNISIPGLTDTTFQGESIHWRFEHGLDPVGEPERKDVTLELQVLDPPAPLRSPVVFELRWYQLQPELPVVRSYGLDSDHPDGVLFQIISNLGVWLASKGQVRLDTVTDSSISGTLSATLEPYPRDEGNLPKVTVKATFWAPRTTDF